MKHKSLVSKTLRRVKLHVYWIPGGPLECSSDTGNFQSEDEDASVELEGAVGGVVLPPSSGRLDSQELQSEDDAKTSLLDELQKEIDRLRLLSPTGLYMHTQLKGFLIG